MQFVIHTYYSTFYISKEHFKSLFSFLVSRLIFYKCNKKQKVVIVLVNSSNCNIKKEDKL